MLMPGGSDRPSPSPTIGPPPTRQPASTRPLAGPSATSPSSTRTPRPTRQVTPTTEPEEDTPSPSEAPSPSSQPSDRLVFLADEEGRLALWQATAGELSLLAYRVVDYALSGDGRSLVALRASAATEDDRYELVRLDPQTGSSTVLVSDTERIYRLSLSFRGDYLAYTTQESGGRIEILRAIPGSPAVETAACQGDLELDCLSGPVWAADRTALAWSDDQGVWLISPREQDPQLAVSSLLEVTDPRGGTSEVTVRYQGLSWSPNGRYLLAAVSPVNSNVRWLGVLDTRTGRQAEIPGTFETEQERATAAWMSNGQLAVGLPGSAAAEDLPGIQIWNVLPTRDDLLLSQNLVRIPLEKLPWMEGIPVGSLEYEINWLSPLRSRFLSFAVRITGRQTSTALFRLDVQYGDLQEIYDFEAGVDQIVWSPTSQEGVLTGPDGLLLYLPGDGSPPFDLLPEFGPEAHTFTWIATGLGQPSN